MAKIALFNIPAYGHTNPTLEVVRELVNQGNEVRYYSFNEMRERIEMVGAQFISCDAYQLDLETKSDNIAEEAPKDIELAVELLVKSTLAMDASITKEMKEWEPDVIVADSMAVWGKLVALKLNIPFVSSTTTFAMNKYSARGQKQSLGDLFRFLGGMGKAKKYIKQLQAIGYPIKGVMDLITNDNDTTTIVYTSREFQPRSETFSDKYTFVGPSIKDPHISRDKSIEKTIYISLGTVINRKKEFYNNCIEALKDSGIKVIMSIGNETKMEELGQIPSNFSVEPRVNQIEVLRTADGFITHCGMNSVNEALYFCVPLIMFPQTVEQYGVANRVKEMNAGIFLADESVENIKIAVEKILNDPQYREGAERIAESFRNCGGPKLAAQIVLDAAHRHGKTISVGQDK